MEKCCVNFFLLLVVMFSICVQEYAAAPAQKNVTGPSAAETQDGSGEELEPPQQAEMLVEEIPATAVPLAHSIESDKTMVLMEIKKIKKTPKPPNLNTDIKTNNKKPTDRTTPPNRKTGDDANSGGTNKKPPKIPPNKNDKKKPTETNTPSKEKVDEKAIINSINYSTFNKKINRRKSIISTISLNSTSSINPPKKLKSKNKPPEVDFRLNNTVNSKPSNDTWRPTPRSPSANNNGVRNSTSTPPAWRQNRNATAIPTVWRPNRPLLTPTLPYY